VEEHVPFPVVEVGYYEMGCPNEHHALEGATLLPFS
jgi:hypothetical protein